MFLCCLLMQKIFGVVVVEALASKTPIVISDGVAIHPDISRAEAGTVVPVGDVEALTQALRQLLKDENQRDKFKENGYQLAQKKYSLTSMGQSLARLYREIV